MVWIGEWFQQTTECYSGPPLPLASHVYTADTTHALKIIMTAAAVGGIGVFVFLFFFGFLHSSH
jgi:hypothetical protein